MPYRKSYNKKRSYTSRAGSALSIAHKALTTALMVKRLLNVEFNHHDVQTNLQAIGTTATITQLSNISQGDTSTTRDGDSIKITAISGKYDFLTNPSATVSIIRIMLVLDKQTNGAIYSIGDLLEDTTAQDILVTPLNLDNKHRFKILWSRKIHLSKTGEGGRTVKFYKKVSIKLRYGTNLGTIADLNSDSLSLVMVSTQATNTPTVTSYTRLRYIDN